MSRKWFWALLIVVAVGGLASGLLYRRYKTLVTQKTPEPQPRTQNSGSAVITYSKPGPNEKEYLRTAVLNELTVEDLSLETVEVEGERKPLLNLTVSFDYQGVNRKLTIPVVVNILLRKLALHEFEEGELISVERLNLKKGTLVNLAFSYLPKESATKKGDLIKFCEAISYQLCLMYIELGFGDSSIDFGTYLESTLGEKETAKLDYKLVFPNTLFQRTD